jgi:predicted CXXCH cytochrome family protein
MKTISKVASGVALLAASSAAMAAFTGIAGTKHNLGAAGSTNHTTGTTEICVFCHTPHGADQGGTTGVSAPLWNRVVSSSTVYTRYSALGTTTFDANEAPIGSVSIACLSCHDGTQAMDTVINFPGADSIAWALGTQTGHNNWQETNMMSTLKASDNGTTGDMIYLGTDLRNDHPVSMQYGGGGIYAGVGAAHATNDPDYAQAIGSSVAVGSPGTNTALGGTGVVNNKTINGNKQVWWVDTGTAGQQKSDFTLFTRTDGNLNTVKSDANTGTAQPYVECATCHDPHSTNSQFLRLPGGNKGSQICLTCHTK